MELMSLQKIGINKILIVFVFLFIQCTNNSNEEITKINISFDNHNFKEVIKLSNKFLDNEPNNVYVLNLRSLGYYNIEEYNLALIDINKAITLDSSFVPLFENRALIYSATGRQEKAILDWSYCINNGYQNVNTYYGRGFSKMDINQYKEAIKDFDTALIYREESYIFKDRGLCKYSLSRNANDAISDFNSAISLDTNSSSAYFNRGSMYYSLGQFKQSMRDFSKVLAIIPNHKNAKIWLEKSKEKINEQ